MNIDVTDDPFLVDDEQSTFGNSVRAQDAELFATLPCGQKSESAGNQSCPI